MSPFVAAPLPAALNPSAACLAQKVLRATAFADAYGLPVEGLPPHAIQRRYSGGVTPFSLIRKLGTASDDTEHAARTARAFILSGGDAAKFEKALAWQMRWWFWALPPACGWATLRALFKLSVGVPPSRSGVYSAGNGGGMRAPILGVLVSHDDEHLVKLVDISTRLTHTDPMALEGARLLALWAALAVRHQERPDWALFMSTVRPFLRQESPFHEWLEHVGDSVRRHEPTARWAIRFGLGNGITGFVGHTVPAVLHLAQTSRRSWEGGVRVAVSLGGDTDTVAAQAGALLACLPHFTLPEHWAKNYRDWPCSLAWLNRVGARASEVAASGQPGKNVWIPFAALTLPLRNLLLLGIVLGHGMRRLGLTLMETLERPASE